MSHRILSCVFASVLAAAASADVLVVDAVGGAPGHYTSLQAAVDAAAPGDTVLVDAALHSLTGPVVIDGKGISVLVDSFNETVGVVGQLTVRNLPAGQRVTLRGLQVVAPAPGPSLVLEDNAGAVRLHWMSASGAPGVTGTASQSARPGAPAASISHCADVMLDHCGLGGGAGGDIDVGSDLVTSDGGTGAIVVSSTVSAFLSPCAGGRGGEVTLPVSTLSAGSGGTGLVAEDSQLFFYEEGAVGGAGGDSTSGQAGDGGVGLVHSGAGSLTRMVYTTPVPGGAGDAQFTGAPGSPGAAQVLESGALVPMPSSLTWGRELWARGPVREGEPMVLTGIGFDDTFYVLVGFETGNTVLPAWQGAFMLGAPFSELILLGDVPFLAKDFDLGPAPNLPAGFDAVEFQLQGVLHVLGTGFVLGPPEQFVILDAAF